MERFPKHFKELQSQPLKGIEIAGDPKLAQEINDLLSDPSRLSAAETLIRHHHRERFAFRIGHHPGDFSLLSFLGRGLNGDRLFEH